ncbi:MAG TPA: R3H domain-containing nucleic acid-binding protein [Methylomirabilota bacterium]|jgi:spoIIIJ-associated protein|nr:R3H domain-containing nucleic acid-binding protein [Methylomirabilota bacterium]
MEANNLLKTIILDTLRQMTFDAEVFERQEEGRTVFNVKTRDAQLLIGKQGANLEALQHIIRTIFRKKTGDDRFPFAIDIDDYKDKRVLYLKDLARKAAHHVRDTRKPVALEPMVSYERRVVHNYLSLYTDIGSESVGVEPNRKIVIRPKTKVKDKDGFNFIENS